LFHREWGETEDEFAAAAEIAAALGLRVYLGPAYRSGHPVVEDDGCITMHVDEERGRAGLEAAIRFCRANEGRDRGLVRTMLAPDRVETCTAELVRRSALAAEELGVPIRLHCCQSDFEVETMRARHGMTAPRWLAALQSLSRRMLLPHGTHVVEGDLAILRDAGAVLVHCPVVMGRHAAALRSFSRLRAEGLRIGMGTDTWPPDMILNMQVGMMLNRVAEGNIADVSARDFYNAATLGGADALGRTDLGRLEPGAKADLVVVDLAGDRIGVAIDPIQTLIFAGSGRDVSTVVIDGRVTMADGVIPGFDAVSEQQAAQEQFDRLVSCYPERTWRHPPSGEIFPSSYRLRRRPSLGFGSSSSSSA
jgi:cytosine/adenosine deaminase-related metal-dependent hydrolase